jgi:hypothetical protein
MCISSNRLQARRADAQWGDGALRHPLLVRNGLSADWHTERSACKILVGMYDARAVLIVVTAVYDKNFCAIVCTSVSYLQKRIETKMDWPTSMQTTVYLETVQNDGDLDCISYRTRCVANFNPNDCNEPNFSYHVDGVARNVDHAPQHV